MIDPQQYGGRLFLDSPYAGVSYGPNHRCFVMWHGCVVEGWGAQWIDKEAVIAMLGWTAVVE